MKTSTGTCYRCDSGVYHDGERWLHSINHQPLDNCPDLRHADTQLLARQLQAEYKSVMESEMMDGASTSDAVDKAWYQVAERAKELRA